MMDRFEKQEQSPSTQRLRSLVRLIPSAGKSESEWQVLENELFLRLEDRCKVAMGKKPALEKSSRPLLRPVLTTASIIVAVTTGLFTFQRALPVVTPAALPDSRVLLCSGTASVGDTSDSAISPISPRLMLTRISKGQIFETGVDGGLIVQLDSGTAFSLEKNCRVRITEADTRAIVLHLEKGSVLAMVAKRARDQRFAVTTSDAECTVVGTVFSVAVSRDPRNRPQTALTVFEGQVVMKPSTGAGETASVTTGQSMSFVNGSFGRPIDIPDGSRKIPEISVLKLALDIAGDTLRQWGLVEVTSEPAGAAILLDNQVMGATPMILKCTDGTHAIHIAEPGYRTWKTIIDVLPGQRTNVDVPLTALKKRLHASADTTPGSIRTLETVQAAELSEYVNKPEYIEALIQLTVGEYRKALVMLESLNDDPDITNRDRANLFDKIALCYKGIGDYSLTMEKLREKYAVTADSETKGSFLWQIATLQTQCLQDYRGAVQSLTEYTTSYPNGAWNEVAYLRCAELQYVLGQAGAAATTYEKYMSLHPSGLYIDRALFYSGTIMSENLGRSTRAADCFTTILTAYPQSRYRENALYLLAGAYTAKGDLAEARRTYQSYMTRYPEGRWAGECEANLTTHY
jgi:TolA-binding protein